MRCVICKQPSDASISVEHIIPESLGNEKHLLPKGIVCDSCNNYISREIEGRLLESPYFRDIRFRKGILSKKRRYPAVWGLHPKSRTLVEFVRDPEDDSLSMGPASEKDNEKWIKSVTSSETFSIYVPAEYPDPDRHLMSRFIAKVGIETLAASALDVKGGLDEIVNKAELDELREHIRIGDPSKNWPYHSRRIYPENFVFVEEGQSCEILHEFMILVTLQREFYVILALFGVEYALNLGGPEIDGYLNWLEQNNNRSPLSHSVNSRQTDQARPPGNA